MGKIITRVIAFLLLGAIVNVAVAWGCSLTGVADPRFLIRNGYPSEEWLTKARNLDAEQNAKQWWYGQTHHGFERLDWIGVFHWRGCASFAQAHVALVRAGWPTRALVGEQWLCPTVAIPGSTRAGNYQLVGAHPLDVRQHEWYQDLLPLRPIWPGLAINIAFYAVALWLLFAAPFALRRWRRGLCPACAYPVGPTKFAPSAVKPSGSVQT